MKVDRFLDWPMGIADGEVIVRAGLVPHHFKKNKRTTIKDAFHLPYGTDSISAMRGSFLSADHCKRIAIQHVQNLDETPPKKYCGLWTIQAACIRRFGADVKVTPGLYVGHVSIKYGVTRLRQDALRTPEDVMAYNRVLEGLYETAQYFADGLVEAECWTGVDLVVTSCLTDRMATDCVSADILEP